MNEYTLRINAHARGQVVDTAKGDRWQEAANLVYNRNFRRNNGKLIGPERHIATQHLVGSSTYTCQFGYASRGNGTHLDDQVVVEVLSVRSLD